MKLGANRGNIKLMKTNGTQKRKKGERVGNLPHWTDYVEKGPLTKEQEELREAFREAMVALREEERKYGKKDYSLV